MSQRHHWNRFVQAQRHLLMQLDIPAECYERQDRFDRFLMHGQDYDSYFRLPIHSELDDKTRGLVTRLLRAYFQADGIGDPPDGLLSGDEHQRLRAEQDRP